MRDDFSCGYQYHYCNVPRLEVISETRQPVGILCILGEYTLEYRAAHSRLRH
jgi:hypothetical protein